MQRDTKHTGSTITLFIDDATTQRLEHLSWQAEQLGKKLEPESAIQCAFSQWLDDAEQHIIRLAREQRKLEATKQTIFPMGPAPDHEESIISSGLGNQEAISSCCALVIRTYKLPRIL